MATPAKRHHRTSEKLQRVAAMVFKMVTYFSRDYDPSLLTTFANGVCRLF
jgi:hypothetical protein